MKRRVLFLVTGSFVLSGCVSSPDNTDPDFGESSTATPSDDDGTDEIEGDDTDDTDRTDSIYVENLNESEIEIEITLEKEETGIVFQNQYKVPGETGLEIPDAGRVEDEYEVMISYDGDTETVDWYVYSCQSDHGVAGSSDFGVVIEESGWYTATNDCDAIAVGSNSDIEYVSHKRHKTE